jgi:hypothetical protein
MASSSPHKNIFVCWNTGDLVKLFPTGHLASENPTSDQRPATIDQRPSTSGQRSAVSGDQVADLVAVGRS